ncbi:MAG: hypothetical protein ABTR07_14445 [Candidatus Competibacter denitrificans]
MTAAEVQSDPPAEYTASPRITNAARQVAEGEDAVSYLRAAADRAAEVVAKLDARIAATSAKRAALIDRRAAGQGDDDEDASTLALIDADIERLQQLRIIAAHDYTNAARAVDERALHLRDAQRELDAATAAHQAELLEPQLREVERTLLAGIGRLATLKRLAAGMGGHQRLHARQVFSPTPALGRFVLHNVIPDDVTR